MLVRFSIYIGGESNEKVSKQCSCTLHDCSSLAGCGNKRHRNNKGNRSDGINRVSSSTEAVSETQAAEGEAATVQVYIAASLSNAMDEISANYKSVQPNVDLCL